MVASQPAAVVCALYAVIEGLEFRPPTICKHQGASMLKKNLVVLHGLVQGNK